MGILYTPHDDAVRKSVRMIMRGAPPDFPDPATDSYFEGIIGTNWPFQFPPRVKSDTKGGDWEEKNKVSFEPVAFWTGAQPRKITIEATYVVTGESEWNGDRIAKIAHAAKAYFYRSIQAAYKEGSKGFGPTVEIHALYGAVQEKSTWRMFDVGVEYSETFVSEATPPTFSAADFSISGSGGISGLARSLSSFGSRVASASSRTANLAWPLKTTITFNLASYTQIKGDGETAIMPAPSLEEHPTPRWY